VVTVATAAVRAMSFDPRDSRASMPWVQPRMLGITEGTVPEVLSQIVILPGLTGSGFGESLGYGCGEGCGENGGEGGGERDRAVGSLQ